MKRKTRLSERLSVLFVRLAAASTIAVLFLILGYIMWNGFFYRYQRDYSVTSGTEDSFAGVLLVADRDLHPDALPFDTVQGIFGDQYTSWKRILEKDVDLYPLVEDSLVPVLPEILGIDEPGVLIEYPGDTRAVVTAVASRHGSVALVSRESFLSLESRLQSRVRVLDVRPYSLAVNPSVTALQGNMRIGTIPEKALASLYRGDITNWSELNGYDLPVTIVLPPTGSELERLVSGFDYADGSARLVRSENERHFYELLASISGSAAIAPARLVTAQGLSFVRLIREESGRNLDLSFLLQAPADSGKIGGISTIIVNTLYMILLTLVFAVPPGLFAAIYLVEYARQGKLVRVIRLGVETLAGIPSIIFGLFGMLVFVQGFGWGISLLSGACTLTLMILPTIVRTAEEALKSVNRNLHEGSLALGATRIQTIFRVVLPAAFPAIASGIILAIGRALGETAALLYTMGSNYRLSSGLFDSTRTLAVHIYLIIAEGIPIERAFASGAILVFFILIINASARYLIDRMGRMTRA